MKKFFEKHETLCCMLLIVLYIVINSFCMQNFGIADYRSSIVNTLLSVGLIVLIIKLDRVKYYGLTGVKDLRNYLYFIPLLIIVSVNLWGGIDMSNSSSVVLFHILSMINVGFLEEIIFRGFLFKMMEQDSLKSAIIVTSITFGIGHIINLVNGAEIVSTLLQICYAISIGFLFAIILCKSKSLIPCIVAHAVMNSLSIFKVEDERLFYIISGFLIIAPVIYAIYIIKRNKTAKNTKIDSYTED